MGTLVDLLALPSSIEQSLSNVRSVQSMTGGITIEVKGKYHAKACAPYGMSVHIQGTPKLHNEQAEELFFRAGGKRIFIEVNLANAVTFNLLTEERKWMRIPVLENGYEAAGVHQWNVGLLFKNLGFPLPDEKEKKNMPYAHVWCFPERHKQAGAYDILSMMKRNRDLNAFSIISAQTRTVGDPFKGERLYRQEVSISEEDVNGRAQRSVRFEMENGTGYLFHRFEQEIRLFMTDVCELSLDEYSFEPAKRYIGGQLTTGQGI